jgi:hypothetical protein
MLVGMLCTRAAADAVVFVGPRIVLAIRLHVVRYLVNLAVLCSSRFPVLEEGFRTNHTSRGKA